MSELARGLQGAELEQALDHDETRRIAEACSATEPKAFDVELAVACHMATLRNRLHDGVNMFQAIKATIREAVIEARARR
jgi:hypothetical protein